MTRQLSVSETPPKACSYGHALQETPYRKPSNAFLESLPNCGEPMTEPTSPSTCTYTEQTTHHEWRCALQADHQGQHVLRAIRCDLPKPCYLNPDAQLTP